MSLQRNRRDLNGKCLDAFQRDGTLLGMIELPSMRSTFGIHAEALTYASVRIVVYANPVRLVCIAHLETDTSGVAEMCVDGMAACTDMPFHSLDELQQQIALVFNHAAHAARPSFAALRAMHQAETSMQFDHTVQQFKNGGWMPVPSRTAAHPGSWGSGPA